MDDLRADIEVVFEGETGVALLVRNSGRGRASGVPASGLYYLACLVREGRIVIGREFASREEAISSARDLDRPAREASS
jgi:ketosteroid isomerase-like protein